MHAMQGWLTNYACSFAFPIRPGGGTTLYFTIKKPFRDQDILDRVYPAFELDTQQQRALHARNAIGERLEQLTPCERDVLELIVADMTNKLIATQLNLSVRTILLERVNIAPGLASDQRTTPPCLYAACGSSFSIQSL